MDSRFSVYGQLSSVPSPVNAMMAAFARDFRDGTDINLGVGYVNESTIPRDLMAAAVREISDHPERYRQAFNYGGPHGSANLLAALRRFHEAHYRLDMHEQRRHRTQFIIGANGATSLLDAVSDVLAPGVIVTADPMYYIYCNTLERKGYRIVAVPEDRDGVDVDRIRALLWADAALREQISFFYFVTVNNPTCTILSNERRRAIVGLAAELSHEQRRQVPVFFDLAYELLLHDPGAPRFESGMVTDETGLVYEIGTLSKILAPALRIGYMAGPSGPFLDAVVQKTSDIGFSASLLNQETAAILLDRHLQAQLQHVNAGYREKALAVRTAIENHLGPWIEDCCGGRAGFYYYLTFRQMETHVVSHFFRLLTRTTGDASWDGPENNLRPRVIYVPGEYCVHPRGLMAAAGRRQLRLSYGFEDVPAIEKALQWMQDAACRCASGTC